MKTVFKLTMLRIALAILFATIGLTAVQSQEQAGPQAAQADTSAQSQPKRVRVSQGVSTGLLMMKVNPKYPEEARQRHIQGSVVFKAVINTEGTVAEVTPVSGDPLLIPAALNAVKKWKYKPYLFNGNPVEVETTIQMNFTLSGR